MNESDDRRPQWELDYKFNEIVSGIKTEFDEEALINAHLPRTRLQRILGHQQRNRLSGDQISERMRWFTIIACVFPLFANAFVPANIGFGLLIAAAVPLYWIFIGRFLEFPHRTTATVFWIFAILALIYVSIS